MSYTSAQLEMLKTDLGRRNLDADQLEFLGSLLETARSRISKIGIHLEDFDFDHDQLLVMYAAYLYRFRVEDKPMPKMLRSALHDELCRQKMEADA